MTQDDDRQRDIAIYRYLLRQALVFNEDGTANFRQTAQHLGKTAADFAIRIYKEVHGEEQKFGPAKLTTGKLVELIEGLQKELEKTRGEARQGFQVSRQLTGEEIARTFQKLIQLSPEEKEALGLGSFEEESILQQALLNIDIYNPPANRDAIWELYQRSVGFGGDRSQADENCLNEQGLDGFISKIVTEHLQRYGLQDLVEKYSQSVKKVIDRIQYQIGLESEDKDIKQWFAEKNLTNTLIRQVSLSVIENKLLNEEFPIYIKFIKTERLKPLPLQIVDDPDRDPYGVINQEYLIELREDGSQITEEKTIHELYHIRFHHGYKISIVFAAKVPDSSAGKKEIQFTVSSSGVGGKLTHIARIIDRTLFWDVECLRNLFFPIVSDLVTIHNLQRNDSPVVAHNLVKLCRLESMKKALKHKSEYRDKKLDAIYQQESYLDEIGRGDYCGFDFIETSAKSLLQARLRAIKNSGEVNSIEYLKNLQEVIARVQNLKIATSYIKFYPFSLSATENEIKKYIFQNPQEENLSEGGNTRGQKHLICYDSELLIIHSYLVEGLYSKAYAYLGKLYRELESLSKESIRFYDKIQGEIDFPQTSGELEEEDHSEQNFKIFSGSLLAKYELYKGFYYLVYDIENDRDKKFQLEGEISDRLECIEKALQCLESAEKHLKLRTAKYQMINEITKNYFHPYFQILAQIYYLRSKIYLFFPQEITSIKQYHDEDFIKHRFQFLEKARIYAAKDGDTDVYAYITAWEAWAYIINIYKSQESDHRDRNLRWARKLIYHSLMAYAETGNKCYYEIKEKSGSDSYINIDNYQIDSIPAITEFNLRDLDFEDSQSDLWRKYQSLGYFDDILRLDMSLLHIKNIKDLLDNQTEEDRGMIDRLGDTTDDYNTQVYLFGTKACILLFSIGVYELCSSLSDSIFLKANNFSEWGDRQKWINKIFRAYRVFSYAFAIAEDGGRISLNSEDSQHYIVERPDFQPNRFYSLDYHSPDVDSVRDLYPHRITEIADLGKVYAAACNLLLISLVENPRRQEELKNDATRLLSKLGDVSRSYAELVKDQTRFNGHLWDYLTRTRQWISEQLDSNLPLMNDPESITNRRNEVASYLYTAST